ncbi:hypothetical protein [Bacillus xiapuensis]|uniref:Uncharacterized protein n=1 Tax=Bacillus xiapuensis TaxID=2014075 RepID=A0ABU6N805_9BACI|nr:hypothetical protein [Bacillus xiapuensis]
MKIMPRRGKSTEMYDVKFTPHELFYVTDLRVLGVVNDNGEPQLLVEVLEFDTKNDFPTQGQASKLYREREGDAYFFDGQKYLPVGMNVTVPQLLPFLQGKNQVIKVNLGK